MARGKGLKPSAPHRIMHRLGAHLHPKIADALRSGPAGSADLSPFRAPRMNQRSTSKCHAHSRAQGLYTAWGAVGKPLSFVPSPEVIAACTYADMRDAATPPNALLPVLVDDGASLQDSSDATNRWGLAPIGLVSTDPDQYTDCPDNTAGGPTPEPDRTRVEVAGAYLQAPEYAIDISSQPELVLIAGLDAKIPFQTGNPVGPSYEALRPGQIAMSEPGGSGHAQVIDGYRRITASEAAASGSTGDWIFYVDGSWGLEFADQGIALVSVEWVRAGWEYFPLTIGGAP